MISRILGLSGRKSRFGRAALVVGIVTVGAVFLAIVACWFYLRARVG